MLASSIVIQAWPPLQQDFIDTVAGSQLGYGGDGGPATGAQLTYPFNCDVDAAGNLYIADTDNNRIRRVDAVTGIITTVAGNGTYGSSGDGGPATNAAVQSPQSVAVDSLGNLFIPTGNYIRRVDAATGIITTVAGNGGSYSGDGGLATNAGVAHPSDVATDTAGNLYIAEDDSDRVRRVDAVTGIITTIAGNGSYGFSGDGGPATLASFRFPSAVALDTAGNLYISDQSNQRVRRVDAVTGIITTVAGNGSYGSSGDGGVATAARLGYPAGLAFDSTDNLYIADSDNYRVRRVDAATGIISTVAGNGSYGFSGDGGPATSAQLSWLLGVAIDDFGNLFIADTDSSLIRRVFP